MKLVLFLAMLAIGLGTIVTLLKPALKPNTVLMQSDILQGIGMSKEINDHRKTYGEEPLWTSRLFGGMPAYQVNTLYEGNLFRQVDKILKLEFLVPPVIGTMFLLFLGMFILLVCMKVDPFTSAMGAMAFMMGSYLYTLLEAGHNSKINTLAYVPMTLAGISLIYRGRFLLGGALMAFFTALSINANHIQTTYYGMFILGLAVISALATGYSLVPRIIFLSLLVSILVSWMMGLGKSLWLTTAALAVFVPLVMEGLQRTKDGLWSNGFVGFLKGKGLNAANQRFRNAVLGSLVVLVAAAAAAGPNTARLLTNQEYVSETMRGGVVLKRNQPESEGNGNGLTKEYAYQWSNGVAETFTLFNPYYMGDKSSANVGKDSKTYDILQRSFGQQGADILSENWPTYFGALPFTSGPNWVGSIVCFLFILGLFVAPNKYRWYLLAATIFGVMLSWGKNFQWFSDLFFDNLPLYNKFRAVSTMSMIAEVTMPVLAALGVSWFIRNPHKKTPKQQATTLLAATGTTLLILFALWVGAPGTNGFKTDRDAAKITGILGQAGVSNPPQALVSQLQEALVDDRASMFTGGIMSGMLFTLLGAGLLFLSDRVVRKSLSGPYAQMTLQAVVGLGLLGLVMVEMIPVTKRYVDEKSFVPKQEFLSSFNPTAADNFILADKDPNFRVLNLTRDPWNDAVSCYHHKMIGGYHPAKFRRYNDLIQYHYSKETQAIISALSSGGPEAMNKLMAALQTSPVLRMANCKYIIYNSNAQPIENPFRMGNAWVVRDLTVAEAKNDAETEADVAIEALAKVDISKTMVVEKASSQSLQGFVSGFDSTASVKLLSFAPNALSYEFNSSNGKEQLVVFSEVYYNSGKGWQAYLDGKPVDHFRCNYVLRGMKVPSGKHQIEFKFEPASFRTGYTIDLALSSTLLLIIAGLIFLDLKVRSKDGAEDSDSELA